ncbi:MAG: branched-chain amino acid ABC transporter permease, partial [Gammaproteobacteria bacterium]|nr:branched-chain amino acid ABC transporter permease [Gammaproteobacteria bacterium]
AFILGIIALSLSFLGGYGGMVSLAQMTVAGIAGYSLAILGVSSNMSISLGWPWWVAVLVSIGIATLCATVIGWLSVRTEGIYTIMITLAVGMAFYYLVLQNYSLFNGFQGLRNLHPPAILGVELKEPMPFYYLALVCAILCYFLVKWTVDTPFGLALRGVKNNPRRMVALGFNRVAHRVAAYALAGFIASTGGILLVWFNGLIAPGLVGMTWLINILIIAVMGGMGHPIGAFCGALLFVLLKIFAIDFMPSERFNLLIGMIFILIVLLSSDGLIGIYQKIRQKLFFYYTKGV